MYRGFCATLWAISETAVICDGEFFSGVVETARAKGEGGTIDVPRLKLLAALVCPGRAQTAHIRRRTFAVDDYDRRRGQFSGHVYEQVIGRALQSFQDFATSPESRALRSARRPGLVLANLEYVLATAPGMDWYYDIEVSTFGPDWALVLSYEDAEDRQSAAFPSILGFAARSDFPWSVASVLAHDIHGTQMPTLMESSGWSAFDENLLTFCWTRDGDDLGLGRYLLEMDRQEIRAFFDACEGMSYETIVEQINTARNELDALEAGDTSTEEKPRLLHGSDLFQRFVEVIDRADQEEERRTRIPRRVAWLAEAGSGSNPPLDDALLRRAVAEFEGLSPAETREVFFNALRHSESAMRGARALARLRLSLRNENEYPKPYASVLRVYGRERTVWNDGGSRARGIMRGALSEADAREIVASETADPRQGPLGPTESSP